MSAAAACIARRLSQIVLSVCVMCGLLAGTVGFTVAPPVSIGGRFPCDGHACGCRTAADCWGGCCCLSPAQRLQWAEANGVEPPAILLKHVDTETTKKDRIKACCSGHGGGSCCVKQSQKPTCCGSRSKKQATKQTGSPRDDGSVCQRSRCHGPGQWWVSGSQPLALPERPLTLVVSTLTHAVSLFETEYSRDAQSPPTRPG